MLDALRFAVIKMGLNWVWIGFELGLFLAGIAVFGRKTGKIGFVFSNREPLKIHFYSKPLRFHLLRCRAQNRPQNSFGYTCGDFVPAALHVNISLAFVTKAIFRGSLHKKVNS